MNKPFFFIFQPIRTPSFLKLFLFILVLLVCIVFIFIRPDNLDQSDFMLIAWYPGQQLLHTGFVDANYPYPLWTVIVMLPLVVWAPKTAMMLMFVCNMLMLSASLTLFVLIFKWELSPVLLVLGVSLSVFFLPVLSSLWLGQLTIFSLLILALTLFFYFKEKWGLLGAVLGLSFIKPQVMLLLVGLLLLWAFLKKKWEVLVGFSIVVTILILISLPLVSTPMQLIGGGISSHLGSYILMTSTIWGATMSLGMSWLIPLLISITLLLWLGWIWLPFLVGNKDRPHEFFLFSIAVIVNLVVIPYSWMHNLTLLLLPVGYSLLLISQKSNLVRVIGLILVFLVMYPLMYLLFILIGIPQVTQAYQIIPALFLLLGMMLLENKNIQTENFYV
ncbi:MAG TPA: glycosyltransferase family 87 protein [Anaerolineales bacterium]|nr:glycosyltransferase family 87 protein [Anaerolineales bacterium]HNE03046.1 glycosyltransferase family 87 protein [Anaerolineales bacterium]HNF94175.1 glycosyltransferase family 87 protein [Anaerolineales bacterium]HNM36028.1 glycosyltransferase family 87 protein [Anaerolineales bacterium]HNO93253.1 glycosyltransferase family 87 protein [Anaerolineales bacterium]